MLPATDNHAHANQTRGMGAFRIAERFAREGGILLVIVSLPSWSLGLEPGSLESLEKMYSLTVEAAREAGRAGVKSLAILGLHPAEAVKLLDAGWSREKTLEFAYRSVELAARYVREGLAAGFGEYGRPHWEAPREAVSLCEEIMLRVFEAARDVGGVVHLHTERRGAETARSVFNLASKAGLQPGRVVLHHASPDEIKPAASLGLVPSVPVGRRGELEKALREDPVYVVESDFLDDPARPGAVIPPWTLARKLRKAVENGLISKSYHEKIMIDNPSRLYGVTLP